MQTYKLIALDMDGTLLNDTSEISSKNAAWIHKAREAGMIVCFSTGRGFQSALPYAEQLQLDTPMITVNGGEIWHRPHVLYRRTYLNEGIIGPLLKLAQEYDTWFWGYTVDKVYNRENWLEPGQSPDDLHWLKFGYDTKDDKAREEIVQEISNWGGLEISNSSPTNLEINSGGISKASALQELCGLLNLNMSQVVAVGDSLNDIAAIREAGLGIAMGNAQDLVKQAADAITVSNNEDGIAHVLEHIVKI
ncbi:Cof-type HAD-IIB family hydrolase [Paenibacillus sp. GCM10012307]|uniref:HAD family phosphatase n=1 Tax=Paenibacillus roseus TaxID=2798579 RepID=A0A934IZW9_9BACL|nr:Cof-type HAD-IIB family hydrolase [Paenibacillus roseus]MBJ6362297.1 HAD family phosphatase [Paenibacillus roseus]